MDRRKLFPLIPALCLLLPMAAGARDCGTLSKPFVNVSVKYEEKPTHQTSDLARNTGGHLAGQFGVMLKPEIQATSGGCYKINRIDMQVTVNYQIAISNRYPAGTCEYNVVYAHESRHKRVMTEYFDSLHHGDTRLRAVELLSKNNMGFPAGGEKAMTDMLSAAASQIIAMFEREHGKLQYDKVDHPDLQAKEQAKCRRW